MLYGLDIFSGIGGITKALEGCVKPLAYCESDKYAQAVLLSRMESKELPTAPIWSDIRTLRGEQFRGSIDILYGGFPCQDISIAGRRKGLEGKRSGLFFEIMRLVDDIRPRFLFLENVPNVINTGLERVLKEITQRGYDCRWKMLSAAEIGAPHKRNRWWLLGYSKHHGPPSITFTKSPGQAIPNYKERKNQASKFKGASSPTLLPDANSGSSCICGGWSDKGKTSRATTNSWWSIEPDVGRVADGVPFRVDRIKCLGNAVVPKQARIAFLELMGNR